MADYRPMPRGAYDANGRPIGRWPEPPEPVAPRQDLLPTPAPAPAPVQRTSPGGVGWMPNKQERDMMQDLYPESTQRPPTRLEKFFQWLSGSSDAGASVNYDPNARGFALQDATIPTAAVTNTSTATPPVYVDFLRPDMQGLVQQEASRMTAQPELRRAYNGVVDYTSDNIVPAIEGYREPASGFVSRQVLEPVIGGVPSRAPGAPDIPPFRWGVEGRNTAGGLFRAPELDGLYDRAVDYTSGTIIPAARDAYDRAVDYTSGTIIPAISRAADATSGWIDTAARAYGGETRAQAATLSLPGGRAPLPTAESYPDHFYVPGGRIGAPSVTAPPPAPVTTSPEIAVPYAGGTYYRNDSSGVPVLSNVPGGTSGIGFNSAPAYAMGTTLAAQRPDIYNPDGTPRQTTLGGQAIDPTLGPALEQMQALTKELQASNPRGGAPVIVGGESPFDVAARRIRNSNLSIGTQMRYLADLDKQRAEAERSAANNATQLRVADIGAQSAAARLQAEDRRSQERNSIDNRRLDILDRNSQGREVVEPIVPKLTSVESTTAPNTRIHTAQIGSFAGTGATAQEAIDSANANIVASAAATFEKAISNPTQRAQLEQDLGTTDPGELRKKYMEIVVRRLSTQRRRTQNIGGDYPAE